MALDSNRAVKWVMSVLSADAQIISTLGGTAKVYRRVIPRSATLPAIAVDLQATGQRDGPIQTGPNTHVSTPVVVRVSLWDLDNYSNIEALADRCDWLLDNIYYQTLSDGEIWECHRDIDRLASPRDEDEGDVAYLGWHLLYRISVKSTS